VAYKLGTGVVKFLKNPIKFMLAQDVAIGSDNASGTPARKNLIGLSEAFNAPRGYIESYGTFLPETTESTYRTVKNVQHVRFIPLRHVTGIKKRRVTDSLSAFDLASKAIEKCLARSKYKPTDIDLVISCNICKSSADGREFYYQPTTAIRIRQEFGLKSAITFDINNACAGMMTGVYLAHQMIRLGTIRRALIVSGERISHMTTTAQREIRDLRDPRLACLTLGDAGAAVVIDGTSDQSKGISYFTMRTLPEYSRLCTAFPTREPHGGIIMHTKSKQLTTAGRLESANLFFEKLKTKDLSLNSQSLVIHHQVSKGLPPKFADKINELTAQRTLSYQQMYDNVTKIGNIASTSHVVALAKAIASGRVREGTDVVFVIQSSGLNIGVLHYKMDGLAGRMRSLKKGQYAKLPRLETLDDIKHDHLDVSATRRLKVISIAEAHDQQSDTVNTAREALNSCLETSQVDPSQLSHLVHAGLYRSNSIEEPSHASLIAGGLGLKLATNNQHLFSFDIVNDGLGWINALYALTHLVDPDDSRYVAITASECDENKLRSTGEPLNISELGTCTLLALSEGKSGFSHFHFRSFTDHINDNEVKYLADGLDGYHLKTTSHQFETNIQNAIIQTVTDELNNLKLTMDDFSAVVLPQRSKSFVAKMGNLLNIEPYKIINVCNETDHFSSSVPLAMQSILNTSSLKDGDKILVIDVASGIQVGLAIYVV